MKIWFNKEQTLAGFDHWNKHTMGEHLGMRI